jgi:ribose-phosphate pyrophosphokinase
MTSVSLSGYVNEVLQKERSTKLFYLFGPPSTADLRKEIQDLEPLMFQAGDIKWGEFEDGFPNLLIEKVNKIQGRDVVFLADFMNPRELFAQMSVLYAMPKYLVNSLTILMPYFPTGTMERVDFEGQIATAFTLARLLSSIPLTIRGPSKLVIYDIHALQERFYFTDSVIPVLCSAVPLFLRVLRQNHAQEKVAIAFPDEGAQKRFGHDFPDQYHQIICSKVRDGNKRVVKVKEGDVEGYDVFIVDDLVKTGGTLIECKNVLLQMKAKTVSAFVTHAVFPLDSHRRFVDSGWRRFYTTNSCPTTCKKLAEVGEPFQVLTIAESLADQIIRF